VAAVARADTPRRDALVDAAAIAILWLLFALWAGRGGLVTA
jgi:hypothetical protein